MSIEQRYAQLLHELSADLTSLAQESITRALPIAIALIEKLQLSEPSLNLDNTYNRERLLLFLAISKRWNTATIDNDISQQKQLARLMAEIYETTERAYEMAESNVKTPGASRELRRELIAHYWPETNGDIMELRHQLGYLDDNEQVIIRFPVPLLDGVRYVSPDLSGSNPIDWLFGGVAYPELNTALIWRDASERTEIHELNHLRYPGLQIGSLMYGVNEGITEQLTLEEIGYGILGTELRSGRGYNNQLRMFRDMEAHSGGILDILKARYQENSIPNSNRLFSGLINRYGLDGMLDLALVRPYVSQAADNDIGLISSKEFVTRHEIPMQSPYDDAN